MREEETGANERMDRLETLISSQLDLIKKLEHENQRLRMQTRALSKQTQGLKETNMMIDREPA